MNQAHPFLCTAGNVEVPAYLVLIQKGYTISSRDQSKANDGWYAEKEGRRFQADSLIAMLGLVTMYEVRGNDWTATDEEITSFLQKYEN
jgi:hypothetical protein